MSESDFMGVDITPATLADGTLYHALDPLTEQGEKPDSTEIAGPGDAVGAIGATTITATPATTGGTLAAGTHYYKVVAIGEEGAGPASAEVSAVTTGSTGTVALTWTAVQGETGGWQVFGRTQGAELKIGTIAHGTRAFTDDNSVTPTGAIPAESDEAKAGEPLNKDAPQPVDTPQPTEHAEGSVPTEVGEGVTG